MFALIHILITLVLPPLGVFMKVGIGFHFWLNLVLTILGVVPGQIHGIWILVKK